MKLVQAVEDMEDVEDLKDVKVMEVAPESKVMDWQDAIGLLNRSTPIMEPARAGRAEPGRCPYRLAIASARAS